MLRKLFEWLAQLWAKLTGRAQTSSIATGSVVVDPGAQAASKVLDYNNELAIFKTASIFENPLKGVTIHKIDVATAKRVSVRVGEAAKAYGLPVTYVLGCLAIESTLDPACENGNFAGSNPSKAPDGFDVGIAQLKLKYLPDEIGDVNAKRAYALDLDKAIPYHCKNMAERISWAEKVIEKNTSRTVDPRMNDRFMLATAAYNFGYTGVMPIYESGQFPTHCQHVWDLEKTFAEKLGLPSCLPSWAPAT